MVVVAPGGNNAPPWQPAGEDAFGGFPGMGGNQQGVAVPGYYQGQHAGRDAKDNLGPGMVPRTGAKRHDAVGYGGNGYYGGLHAGRDAKDNLGPGMVPNQGAARGEAFANYYQGQHAGRDAKDNLGPGMVPDQGAARGEAFADFYQGQHAGRDAKDNLGPGMVPKAQNYVKFQQPPQPPQPQQPQQPPQPPPQQQQQQHRQGAYPYVQPRAKPPPQQPPQQAQPGRAQRHAQPAAAAPQRGVNPHAIPPAPKADNWMGVPGKDALDGLPPPERPVAMQQWVDARGGLAGYHGDLGAREARGAIAPPAWDDPAKPGQQGNYGEAGAYDKQQMEDILAADAQNRRDRDIVRLRNELAATDHHMGVLQAKRSRLSEQLAALGVRY